MSATVGLCGERLLELAVERLRCRHRSVCYIYVVVANDGTGKGDGAQRLQFYNADVVGTAHADCGVSRSLVRCAELVAERNAAYELLTFRYLAQRYSLAQIYRRAVFKRLEPFYGCHRREVLAFGRNHLCRNGVQRLQYAERHFHVAIRYGYVLDASYLKSCTRVHIYIILLVLAQSAERVYLSVGDDILLSHARVDVHQLDGVVLVASVLAFSRQVHLQHVCVVGDRLNGEVLPTFGGSIQFYGLFRHIDDAVGFVRKVDERLVIAARRLHCVHGECDKVLAVAEHLVAQT